MTAMEWCERCGARHAVQGVCYGLLKATEPERFGWRVQAESRSASETYGVLIARCGSKWRARLLTLPDRLWSVPGGRCTMKFIADSAAEAEDQARLFIGETCRERGLRMTEVPVEEQPHALDVEGEGEEPSPAASARNLRGLRVRYGVDAAKQEGRTGDLSASGLFIATDRPFPVGRRIKLLLELENLTLPLEGTVIWVRRAPDGGRPPGMGVELVGPPALYVHFTKRLGSRDAVEQEVAEPTTA